ncbi:HAMP domain-containing sensor histidine kinase [Pseudactinotalea sp. HY158]|uniref:sensor histidine kinase n=1 Tax=Pseudactinotalea sp. HY158 TaxID=2654547 RepID=UPI00129CEEA5|nr:HAMP domain-containing sensor histidine kinase [Pseudactinotalea sp. HY158]QGH68528.1 HAMP domain-containing protein [Pseudactinotalea sp. HY158]
MTVWRRLSLRARLSAITAVLVLIALGISSGAAIMLLRSSLVQQSDLQLRAATDPLTAAALSQWAPDPSLSAIRPTDYFFEFWDLQGSEIGRSYATTTGMAQPELPTLDRLLDLASENQYATVGSVSPSTTQWRIRAFPIYKKSDQELVAWGVVALPLTSVNRTIEAMTRTVLIVGAGVMVLTALVGSLVMERSLRALRRMDRTAQAVAAGDLSQRVEVHDPHTEVGRLASTFNTMVTNLEHSFAEQEASEARMRQFVSDASHELRTPLASIRGYGELYRMGAVPPEEVAATMGRMENEAARMGALVADLLALTRLDERQGLALAPVDLVTIAHDGVADLGALDPTRPAELKASEPVIVPADENKIRQVVMNLIGNTVQHTPPGTAVDVEVRWADDRTAMIRIVDHGPGISEDDSRRVFERFYRPDSARARTHGGSGLGLAIVATIIAAHGGRVFHEPTPGGGATMVVLLPTRPPGSGPAAPPPAAAHPE